MDSLHDITELRVRLQHERFDFDAAADLLDELRELGAAATPLMPLLVSRIADNSFPCGSTSAVELYLATRSSELLAHIRSAEFWSRVGLNDRCQLFSAGVADLQPELLTYLWQHYSDAGDPNRSFIVQGLAAVGNAAALDVLALIDSRLSSELPELSISAPSDDDAASVAISRVELSSQQQFVQRVRDAHRIIKTRKA